MIQAFDDAIAAAWGEAQRRPWPAGTDLVVARRYLSAGASAQLCREVFTAGCAKRQAKGKPPPKGLGLFEQDVGATIAAAGRPMTGAAGSPTAGSVVSDDELVCRRVWAQCRKDGMRDAADRIKTLLGTDPAAALTLARQIAAEQGYAA